MSDKDSSIEMGAKPPSRYDISRENHVVVIRGENRQTTYLVFEPYRIVVTSDLDKLCWGSPFGLFEFRGILGVVAQKLMRDWKGNKDFTPRKVKEWALTQTKKALAKKLRDIWRETLDQYGDQRAVKVQRAVFAATAQCPSQLKEKDAQLIYDDEYLVGDICKYRAAALSMVDCYVNSFYGHFGWTRYMDGYGDGSWMQYYSNEKGTYSSLNKTLMKMPGGIPVWLARNFQRIHLERPIYDRLELITALSGIVPARRHPHIFLNAKHKEIRKACKMVADHLHQPCSFRKVNPIVGWIQFIADYPYQHNGKITGLAARSIDWHRQLNVQQVHNTYNHTKYSDETEVAKPPIDLPKNNGIKIELLDNVGRIVQEGALCGNCVGSSPHYVEQAIRGDSYLFHAEYDGEIATIQVDRFGRVVQSRGPRNIDNKCSKKAEKVLTRWGKSLKMEGQPRSDYANDIDNGGIPF